MTTNRRPALLLALPLLLTPVAGAGAQPTDAWCAVDGVPRGLNAEGDRLFVGMQSGTVTAPPIAQCRDGG